MKKIILISLILLLPLVCFAKDEFVKSSWPLELIIESDKKEYSVGDDIVLTCRIKNNAKAAVSFFRDTNPTHLNLIVTYGDGKKCHRADSSQVMIGSNAVVTLDRDEEFEYVLQGKIMEGKRNIPRGEFRWDGTDEVEGIYIQFPSWSVYLDNGFGQYQIEAKYKDGSWVETTDPRYLADNRPVQLTKRQIAKELKDKWRGKLMSKSITIDIVEKGAGD